jgi:hypothetical protein
MVGRIDYQFPSREKELLARAGQPHEGEQDCLALPMTAARCMTWCIPARAAGTPRIDSRCRLPLGPHGDGAERDSVWPNAVSICCSDQS